MNKNTSSSILIIISICILISIVFRFNSIVYFWINLAGGVIAALVSFDSVDYSFGITWLSAVAGYWMIYAAFIPGLLINPGVVVQNVITGLILLLSGLLLRRKNAKPAPAIDDIYGQNTPF